MRAAVSDAGRAEKRFRRRSEGSGRGDGAARSNTKSTSCDNATTQRRHTMTTQSVLSD